MKENSFNQQKSTIEDFYNNKFENLPITKRAQSIYVYAPNGINVGGLNSDYCPPDLENFLNEYNKKFIKSP